MSGSRMTPEQQQASLAMRGAGYSITAISERAGVSVSTLKRLFKRHSVRKGSVSQELLDKAVDSLLKDAGTIEIIKREAASLLLDDLALSKRLRQALADATEKLVANDVTEALQVMRAVSSGSVALKSTSETLRKSLGLDKESSSVDELPELVIRVMTDNEIEQVREKASQALSGGKNVL